MITVGLIGCGQWGKHFLRIFSNLDGVLLKIVCDLNIERLSAIYKHYPRVQWTEYDKDVFKNPAIDAVIIATPMSTHFELAKMALEYNKHVLVEKSLTLNVVQAEELIRIAQKKNLILMVDHTYIYSPAVQKIREMLDKRELGEIYHMNFLRTNPYSSRYDTYDTNVMWDLASHDVSIVNYLLKDMPRAVLAVARRYQDSKHENISYLTLFYEAGVLVTIHNSWLTPMKTRTLWMRSEHKSMIYDDTLQEEKVKIYEDQNEMTKVLIPKLDLEEPLKRVCLYFIDSIEHKTPPITDGEFGLKVVRVLQAAQESLSQEGLKVIV